MSNFFELKDLLQKSDIVITDEQLSKFNLYYELLVEWNNKFNLTAITDYEGVMYKHFYDSLSMMKYINLNDKRVIDVGTGAGFPGIPLAIMNPQTSFVLLDSLNKRVTFLNEVKNSLHLDNVEIYHGRAEDFGFNYDFRETFDIVTSRAVANLSTLSEYCLPFVKINGYFIPYKSEQADEEIKSAENAFKILGGKLEKVENYNICFDDINNKLVFIKKVKNTGKKYPRKAGTPSKMPL